MKSLFVMACYYDGSNTAVYDCVKSIRKHHPQADIVIVDSDSPDRSYFDLQVTSDVKIIDLKNKNYDTGAYWMAYKMYPNYDFYYMIHDSIRLKNSIKWVEEYKFASMRYFHSSDVLGGLTYISGRTNAYKYILRRLFNRRVVDFDMYGFDSDQQRTWVAESLNRTKYFFPKIWLSLFGPIFFCRNEVLNVLSTNGVMNILPSSKMEQMAMERLLGIVLMQEGIDISISVQGENFKNSFDTTDVQKIIFKRN